MLIFDHLTIGNNLFSFRKKAGMTQAEVAEAAGISDRTYADIERGTVNMRIETLLKICNVLKITPNDILTVESPASLENVVSQIETLSPTNKKTALQILEAYLKSI